MQGESIFQRFPALSRFRTYCKYNWIRYNKFAQADVAPEKRISGGLQSVFEKSFPVEDAKGFYQIDFVKYYVDRPKYDVRECQERGVTYAVPLKATFRLFSKKDQDDDHPEVIEQDVYLGNLPYMTNRGDLHLNGAERVIVSQLHRSPGVFFDESIHPNGTKMFKAHIIPFRGSWIEFTTDINDVMYVYIDRKKKFPVTTFLRALGYSSDREMLRLFGVSDEVDLSKASKKDLLGRKIAIDIINEDTGEIIVDKDAEIDEEILDRLKKSSVKDY